MNEKDEEPVSSIEIAIVQAQPFHKFSIALSKELLKSKLKTTLYCVTPPPTSKKTNISI